MSEHSDKTIDRLRDPVHLGFERQQIVARLRACMASPDFDYNPAKFVAGRRTESEILPDGECVWHTVWFVKYAVLQNENGQPAWDILQATSEEELWDNMASWAIELERRTACRPS